MVYVAADWMVMPLCLSSSMESIVAPTPSFPFTYKSQSQTAHECLHNCANFPAGCLCRLSLSKVTADWRDLGYVCNGFRNPKEQEAIRRVTS